jgi:mannose-1-phosphate guanylyltransferase
MSPMSTGSNSIKGIILAGGPSKGTRFRPLSLCLPKALFPLAGVPMIEHHIDALSRIPGMTEIIILGLYDPSVFDAYISDKTNRQIQEQNCENSALDAPMTRVVPIRYLKEPGALGTAGGLLHFEEEIMKGSPEHLYFLHVDMCSSFPLLGLLESHKRNHQSYGAICTMMGHTIQDRMSTINYGCIIRL